MRKLALSDEILLKIEKPARYIGNEVNSVMKNKNEVDIRFAMCFPDSTKLVCLISVIQIFYDMFNRGKMCGVNEYILLGQIWTRS